jgi:hypothetical protein
MKSKGYGSKMAAGTMQLFPTYFQMELFLLIGLTRTNGIGYYVLTIKCVLVRSNIGYNVTCVRCGGLLRMSTTEVHSAAVIYMGNLGAQKCQTSFTLSIGRNFGMS